MSRVPNIALWEITVKPPGFDGGDPVDTTTMHNEDWRTKAPRSLVEMTNGTSKFAFDPKIYVDILSVLNIEQTLTWRFSDGSTLAVFGFLRTFDIDDMSEGDMPQGAAEIEITNTDPTTGAETPPVLTEVTGT
jgi:hypothetical protein